MSARLNLFFAMLAAVFAFSLGVATPHQAHAGSSGGGTCCVVTPPACGSCTPSKPPCCTPAPPPSCCGGGHQINIPSVNVNVGATVVVNASAQANAVGIAGANANSGATVFYGGGGSSFGITQSSGLIQGLNVEGSAATIRTPYSATRTKIRTVVIQAVCIDDQEIPHPASQVSPERDIADAYEGEVFRCIAGTHMQWTMADFSGKVAFDHGQVINCAKGEALYKSAANGQGGAQGGAGELACRPQRPARDCNERSLLRRFGAGVKVIKIVTVEHYEAFKEETVQTGAVATGGMSIDGGVGGIVY